MATERIISKVIIRNRFGLLETTDKLGGKRHRFFATRLEAARFLKRLHRRRLYWNELQRRFDDQPRFSKPSDLWAYLSELYSG